MNDTDYDDDDCAYDPGLSACCQAPIYQGLSVCTECQESCIALND